MKQLARFLTRLTGFAVLSISMLVSSAAFGAHKGISFQAVLKKPDGTYPNISGLNVTLQVLDPVSECVLREEVHSGINISNGYINLILGSASASTPTGRNPAVVLTIPQVFDNSTPRTGLNCVDANNNITASGQTYTPTPNHMRKLRLRAVIGADTVVADFTLRAVAFAVNSETLDGKDANSFVQTSAAITQSNVESIFSRYAILDSILNGTFAGNASTATALATAPGACTSGQYVSAIAANGTITCGTPPGGGGTVTGVTSANSYLSVATGTTAPVLTVNVGTAANTVAAGDDSRFTDARSPSGTAGGDLSGTYPNPSVAKISGKSVVLTTPASGEFLKYDGTNFVNAAVPADATKLPLAGGTMTGAIDMGSQNLTNLGFVTMSANKSMHLSNNSSDPTGLLSADKGKMWFNSTSNEVKYWNGTAAQALGNAATYTGDRVITTSSTGALQATSCALNQVISFTAAGAITCANVDALGSGFANGGNNFGADASLGNKDNFGVAFKTNNLARMTILADGKVGVGVANPTNTLQVNVSAVGDGVAVYGADGPLNKVSTGTYSLDFGLATSSGYFSSIATAGDAVVRTQGSVGGGNLILTTQNGSGGIWFSTGSSTTNDTVKMRIQNDGTVGIGVTTPQATLDVAGAIKSAAVSNSGTTVDFATGNLQYTSASCGAITLNHLRSGGTYTLAVQGTTGGTCVFTAYSGNGTGALTFKAGPVSMVQTAGKDTLFTFLVMGTTVYAAAIDGY